VRPSEAVRAAAYDVVVSYLSSKQQAEEKGLSVAGRHRTLWLVVPVCAAAVVLSACTAESVQPTESPTPRDQTSQTSSPVDPTDEEWEQVIARFPDAVRPDVELVEFVDMDQWPISQAECSTEMGFPATVVDGGVRRQVLENQEEAAAIAGYVCHVMYQLDPRFTVPLDDEQLETLYAYFVGELSECLESEGYSLGDAPSLSTFSDTYYTEQSWSPYADIIKAGAPDDFSDLEKACPQIPDGLHD